MWMNILVVWVAFLVWEFVWTLASALSMQDTETAVMWYAASGLGLLLAIAGTIIIAFHIPVGA